MKTLRDLYKIGKGPSSSHTMGPEKAMRKFMAAFPEADGFRATLYGSLSLTGKGHMTDRVLISTAAPRPVEVIFSRDAAGYEHPNTLDLVAYAAGEIVGTWRVYSVGGGNIRVKGREAEELPEVYPQNSYAEIAEYCRNSGLRLWQYVERMEGSEIWDYLSQIWSAMKRSIDEGLRASGELAGGLGTQRKAGYLFRQRHLDESAETRENRIVCAYAFAASEQNAGGGEVVTAPTCGSCGVVPSVLLYEQNKKGFSDEEILRALAAGGVIGNLIKTNASISGAECGCQAEIGSACSMASAALAELFGMELDQIEYAAEIAIEHHLGLTCDPIAGLVQIPCIERNAVAAMRAINALSLANFLTSTRKISFDLIVDTMYETGRDISRIYRETAEGGLAKKYVKQ
jgi:L-serine dehydratase